MLLSVSHHGSRAESALLKASFDREPVGFSHDLHGTELFTFDSICALAQRYVDDDYFVASSAPAPGTEFYDVRHGGYTPHQAIERLASQTHRILLKRPEKYDVRFRELLDGLFEGLSSIRGARRDERVVRLDSSIFISSGNAITPFHFDPEITFFFQIEGTKRYHVYAPAAVHESELEPFYVKGIVNIGQIGLEKRDPATERVFDLRPGSGFHQPQNAPHWVQTHDSRSISYAFSFETDVTRARNRTRACNHYLRRVGLHPAHPGTHPTVDALKSEAMRAFIPARKALARVARLGA